MLCAMDEASQLSHTSNSSNNSDYAMEVEVPSNSIHSDLLYTDPISVTVSSGNLLNRGESLAKRKFCSLTQRRKKLVDKYIYEVLTKSKDYDYGEFGSNLWSALLLEYFREDKDQQVGIESIEHWARHTSWGRRMRKAYDIGLQSIKEGRDAVIEFEIAKAEVFRKKSPSDENSTKQRGRRRKSEVATVDADPTAVTAVLNDHDYCKNPWLESFGTVYTLPGQELPHAFLDVDGSERVYDMGAIGGEVEI